jgi:thermostable 8-oxoguanine DNA glycosylase
MYNIDYFEQLENFKRSLSENLEKENLPAHMRYFLPQNIKTISCKEAPNGEWVPIRELEKSAS